MLEHSEVLTALLDDIRDNNVRPSVIIIEGGDGVGKRTLANSILHSLEFVKADAQLVSFPAYDTPTGQTVRKFLHGEIAGDPVLADPYTAGSYYLADRREYYRNHPELYTTDILIMDRSYLSNFFFQGYKIWDALKASGSDLYSAVLHTLSNDDRPVSKNRENYGEEFIYYLVSQYLQEVIGTPLENRDIYAYYCYYPGSLRATAQKINCTQRAGDSNAIDGHEKNTFYQDRVHEYAIEVHRYIDMLPLAMNTLFSESTLGKNVKGDLNGLILGSKILTLDTIMKAYQYKLTEVTYTKDPNQVSLVTIINSQKIFEDFAESYTQNKKTGGQE